MNMRAARSVAWLLPFFLTGCSLFHKTQPPAFQYFAPPSDAPSPDLEHPSLSEAVITLPEQPLHSDDAATVIQTPKPPPRHHRQPKSTPQQQVAAAPPPPPPAPAEPPSVSAIGQLSTGGAGDLRRETDDSLNTTERTLNNLNRALSDQEQKTATQIREYLRQAREALLSNDVDGASTLAAKAKVLLGELQNR